MAAFITLHRNDSVVQPKPPVVVNLDQIRNYGPINEANVDGPSVVELIDGYAVSVRENIADIDNLIRKAR